jgi:hypothetical protein
MLANFLGVLPILWDGCFKMNRFKFQELREIISITESEGKRFLKGPAI